MGQTKLNCMPSAVAYQICEEMRKYVSIRTSNPKVIAILESLIIPDFLFNVEADLSCFDVVPELMAVHVLREEASRMNPKSFDGHVRKNFSILSRIIHWSEIRSDRKALLEFSKVVHQREFEGSHRVRRPRSAALLASVTCVIVPLLISCATSAPDPFPVVDAWFITVDAMNEVLGCPLNSEARNKIGGDALFGPPVADSCTKKPSATQTRVPANATDPKKSQALPKPQ